MTYREYLDISIHAPREGSDVEKVWRGEWTEISIHAPREGSDILTAAAATVPATISIHAPREGSDSTTRYGTRRWIDFNPRSP